MILPNPRQTTQWRLSPFVYFGKNEGYLAYPVMAVAILLRPPLCGRRMLHSSSSKPIPIPVRHPAADAGSCTAHRGTSRGTVAGNARRRLRVQQIIQDTYSHKYETYFGGGYLRFRPGSTLQRNSESAWNVGITDYLWGEEGITADFRGYYGTTFTYVNPYQVFSPSISQYTFMAGPQMRFFEGQHWAWRGVVLAGLGHGNFGTGTGGLPPTLIGLYPDGNSFHLRVAASVDYTLGPACPAAYAEQLDGRTEAIPRTISASTPGSSTASAARSSPTLPVPPSFQGSNAAASSSPHRPTKGTWP